LALTIWRDAHGGNIARPRLFVEGKRGDRSCLCGIELQIEVQAGFSNTRQNRFRIGKRIEAKEEVIDVAEAT
jgi:hypothetical protein